jgi:membrane protein implicated in regulation of membrane protease activity
MHWLIWLGAAILLAVIEMFSLTLVLIMLAGGALAAATASAAGLNLVWQIVIFAVVAVALLLVLRPFLLRHMRKRVPLAETNAAAHIGRSALVVNQVTEFGGRVKLTGEVWSARTEPGAPMLPTGKEVLVLRIDGATAVVQGVSSQQQTATSAPA